MNTYWKWYEINSFTSLHFTSIYFILLYFMSFYFSSNDSKSRETIWYGNREISSEKVKIAFSLFLSKSLKMIYCKWKREQSFHIISIENLENDSTWKIQSIVVDFRMKLQKAGKLHCWK